MRSDPVDGVRDDHDGGDRRYRPTARRGRHRFALGDLPDIVVELILHSSLPTPARILVHRARHHILVIHSVYVLAPHTVFHHQS